MKKPFAFYCRAVLALTAGSLCVAGIAFDFYPVPFFNIQFIPLFQRVLTDVSVTAGVILAGICLCTLLFGRLYCSTFCPLGLFQEVLMFLFRRSVPFRRPFSPKYLLALFAFGTLIGGTAFFIRFIDPYALFISGATCSFYGLSVIGALAVLTWFKGRFFCTHLCPVGTILGIFSKHAPFGIHINKNSCVSCGQCAMHCPTGSLDVKNKQVDNETCVKCLRCLGTCRKNALTYTRAAIPFDANKRRFLAGSAALAVGLLAFKSGAVFSKHISSKVRKARLPAGAVSLERFVNRCLNCNLCVVHCPMNVLEKANADFPVVHLRRDDSFCDYSCKKCSEICPSGAIRKISLAAKQKTQTGIARIDKNVCIQCGLCVRECPRQIIRKEDGGFPQISPDACIGCGACQCVCPVKAISVTAVTHQRVLTDGAKELKKGLVNGLINGEKK